MTFIRFRLLKKDDTARKIKSFWKHVWLIVKALLLSLAVTGVWWVMQRFGIHFPHDVPIEFVWNHVLFLGIPFALFATIAVTKAQNKSDQITVAVLKGDREYFLHYRDEKNRVIMHLMMLASSGFAILTIALFKFPSVWVGVYTIFSATFVVKLVWILIEELEDVRLNSWALERIPPEWLTCDVDVECQIEARIGLPNEPSIELT